MFREKLGKEILFFDGAMGTALQKAGLPIGEAPELFNFTHSEIVEQVHRGYLQAGAQMITTNTFGANRYNMHGMPYSVEQVVHQAISIANKAREGFEDTYTVLDVGSTGKLIEPVGDITFEEIYDVFKEQALAGVKYGCDVILLETFTDLTELRAAVLAVKENTSLPVFATMTFESNMRTYFGVSLEAMVEALETMGVDALGINCSLGPKELKPLVERLMELATIPVMIQPNAGLPTIIDGKAIYNISSDEFAQYTKAFAELGVAILGGCCGTDYQYISKMVQQIKK